MRLPTRLPIGPSRKQPGPQVQRLLPGADTAARPWPPGTLGTARPPGVAPVAGSVPLGRETHRSEEETHQSWGRGHPAPRGCRSR